MLLPDHLTVTSVAAAAAGPSGMLLQGGVRTLLVDGRAIASRVQSLAGRASTRATVCPFAAPWSAQERPTWASSRSRRSLRNTGSTIFGIRKAYPTTFRTPTDSSSQGHAHGPCETRRAHPRLQAVGLRWVGESDWDDAVTGDALNDDNGAAQILEHQHGYAGGEGAGTAGVQQQAGVVNNAGRVVEYETTSEREYEYETTSVREYSYVTTSERENDWTEHPVSEGAEAGSGSDLQCPSGPFHTQPGGPSGTELAAGLSPNGISEHNHQFKPTSEHVEHVEAGSSENIHHPANSLAHSTADGEQAAHASPSHTYDHDYEYERTDLRSYDWTVAEAGSGKVRQAFHISGERRAQEPHVSPILPLLASWGVKRFLQHVADLLLQSTYPDVYTPRISFDGAHDTSATQQRQPQPEEEEFLGDDAERETDEHFMRLALEQAQIAYDDMEVPVGAVLVMDGEVIATGNNATEGERDPTSHAEMTCIRKAAASHDHWRLLESTLYVTVEPCPMCAGAILQSRIGTVVYGAPNARLGAHRSWIRMMRHDEPAAEAVPHGGVSAGLTAGAAAPHPFHPDLNVRSGVLSEECSAIMKDFFRMRRRQAKAARKAAQAVVTEVLANQPASA